MTRLDLPKHVKQYFSSVNDGDLDTLLNCFHSDAHVFDEGHRYQGREAIAQWATESRAKYDFTSHPHTVEPDAEGELVVIAKVTGNFPGSPTDLRYRFALNGNAISTLEIRP